ncbi:MAG: alanine racemase [Patescibacteria group bacterium]|nr:alanine racemase [Patescibacteria group bacterium]
MPKIKEKFVPKTWVEVSANAIKSNIQTFKHLISHETKLMSVVKSNAYGHGLVGVAKVAQSQGVTWFGVDSPEEGIALRANGIKGSILIMGFVRPGNLELILKNKLSFVAYDDKVLSRLQALSKNGFLKKYPAHIHLKIETGTGRQGLAGEELLDFALKIKKIKGAEIQGIYTHFANIEDTTDHSYSAAQLKKFIQEKNRLAQNGIKPEVVHTACSAAAILFPETHFNLIRLGISLYGLWPSKETHAVAQRTHRDIKLYPALTWKTIIAQLKKYPKGSPIGYGLSERTSRAAMIAVVPVGYWDGYDRGLSSVGSVLVHGERCKVVGRVCMNMMMVDVTDVKGVKVEDEVVLIGKQKKAEISAEDFAGKIGTINYEAVTRINPLLPRIIVG